MAKGISADISRKFAILKSLASIHQPTLGSITKMTGLSDATVKRHIAGLRSDFGMMIKFVSDRGNANGYYIIIDWGWVDWAKMTTHLNQLQTQSH